MLDRTIVLPVCDSRLVSRQTKQWLRAFDRKNGGPRTGPGYEYPCWMCGKIGIIGVDGFGAKGLVRPRNFQHVECWDAVPYEQKMIWKIRDSKHILRRYQRHISKRNLDRVAIRERTIYAGYYEANGSRTQGHGQRDSQEGRADLRE